MEFLNGLTIQKLKPLRQLLFNLIKKAAVDG